MKRVGIITFQKIGNLGADLQAYALAEKLRRMGYSAENIDYLYYKHPRHVGGKLERATIPVSLKNRFKVALFPLVNALRRPEGIKKRRNRRKYFDVWFNKNVRVGQEYRSVKSLYDNPPQYDVYMSGSDQIWNPRICSNIAPYFLDFAPEGAKCVSYASSFGVSELNASVFYQYKQWLKRFSHIGVREKSAEHIVKSMALDAEVAHVLDPTMLLTAKDWSKVEVEPNDKPEGSYLLLYDLTISPETVELAKRWAKNSGWRVLRIGDGAYGPGEFIWLFSHAEAVVTNSFHGTVFSLLHHKPFYSVIPKGMSNAGRVESLLQQLLLSHRLVSASACESIEVNSSIDYACVEVKVEKLREESVSFLKKSIDGEQNSFDAEGVPKSCYAVWQCDSAIRADSTSGGVFSALAQDVLFRGGIVYGAAWDNDLRHVRHRRVDRDTDLKMLRKSKYVYSDATDAIKDAKEMLEKNREVLFSGTPCQCAVMRATAKGFDAKLLTVDFVCHGTPKAEVWASYAEELEQRYQSSLVGYEFRNKDNGWNFQNIVYSFANGSRRRVIPWLDPFFHGFSINAFLREGCYKCPFAQLRRISDFTIGDCWRVAASNPEYDDNKGTSLVLVNTDKAVERWNNIQRLNALQGGPYNLDFAQCRNMALMHPPIKPFVYDAFRLRFEETNSFSLAAKCYLSWKKMAKYLLMYYVKKVGWFYFRHHQ